MTFNGGKMVHIFRTNLGKDHDPDDSASYLDEWNDDEAFEALTSPESTMFVKINGSCGMLVRDEEAKTWKIYQRYDDKKDKFKEGKEVPSDYIQCPNPAGPNPTQYKYKNGYVQHRYYFKHLDPNAKGKTEQQINRALLRIVESNQHKLDSALPYISVELCGRNFNKTPGVPEIGIAVHDYQRLVEPLQRPADERNPAEWKQALIAYVTKFPCEGLVVRHPNGRYFKILSHILGVNHHNEYLAPVLL